MQDVIRDIRDITDSREIYEAKPRPFVIIFIYVVLGLLVAILTWLYFGEMDIVIKANGYVRPNEKVSTVKNRVTGEVDKLEYEDGQTVEAGEILYIINHDTLLLEKNTVQDKITELSEDIDQLEKYKESIETGKNNFDKNTQEKFFNKYKKFMLDLQLMENNFSYEKDSINVQIDAISNQIATIKTDIAYLTKLEKSIQIGSNQLSSNKVSEKYYYDKYMKFELDYKILEEEFANKALNMQSSISGELLALTTEETTKQHEGLLLLMQSIKEEKNLFQEDSTYQGKYKDYCINISNLEASYNEAKKSYEINKELEGISIAKFQVDAAKTKLEKAKNDLDNYKNNYLINLDNDLSTIKLKIEELKNGQATDTIKSTLLHNLENDKVNALDKYKTDSLVTIRELIKNKEDTMKNYQSTYDKLKVDISKNLTIEEKEEIIYASSENFKITEIINTTKELDDKKEIIQQYKTKLEQLNTSIEDSIVRAKISGTINTVTDITSGDNVFAGTEVLTVIPNNDTRYKVQILLNNKDIAKLSEDDRVKYHFFALPYKEYGEIAGHVIKISKDIKYDSGTNQNFYLVEATLDNKEVYGYDGNKKEVKVGMACEAHVVTGRKKILRWLLEKINLLD